MLMQGFPPRQGLYDPAYEHDACGVGFICHIKGKASHKIVTDALLMLENMNHRGGCGCEPDSGDGAGIMTLTPDKLFRREAARLGFSLPPHRQYGVAMMFLPKELVARRQCEAMFTQVVREFGMKVLGWRDVPVDHKQVGPTPLKTEPRIRQCFIGVGENFYNKKDFDRRMYLVRQRAENIIEFATDMLPAAREDFYICICSANRIVYKGMLTAHQVRTYYKD